ncbi:hypothetical protein N7490_000126 [Penicillium lividum]|nr:hypothetical protein N7490_000126 [Penicillium lividum]
MTSPHVQGYPDNEYNTHGGAVQRELSDLIIILETTEQNSAELQATGPRFSEVCNNLKQCHDALLELNTIKDHFDSVGPITQVTWKRLGWRENELAAIKARIESHSRTLNHLNTAAIMYVLPLARSGLLAFYPQ